VCVLHCLLGTCHILQTTDIFQIGQRTDVIVKANGNSSGAYWVRSSISRACSTANQPDALAVIYYEKADNNSKPTSTPWPVDDSSCTNDALSKTIPFFPFGPPARPATTQTIDIGFGPNATSSWVWTMNNSTFRANYNNPLQETLRILMILNGMCTTLKVTARCALSFETLRLSLTRCIFMAVSCSH
jgi:hypothetical protein